MWKQYKTIIILCIVSVPVATIAFAAALFLMLSQTLNTPTTGVNSLASILEDPTQSSPTTGSFVITQNNIKFLVSPKADYIISAKVMSKKRYLTGWESGLAPYDLALAWGDITKADADKYISYSQRGRWYYFRYKAGCPYSKKYIDNHSANSHIIPANENVRKALDKVRKGQVIYLEGNLVYIDATINGRNVWWRSSLSRTDSGDGSCELIYAKKIILDNMVYQ